MYRYYMLNGYIPPILVVFVTIILLLGRKFLLSRYERSAGLKIDVGITALIIIFAAILLFAMGRTPTYIYGPVRIWSGDINSNQNSQQIADPYTLTHIIHGAGFYGLLYLTARNLPLGMKAIIAVALESGWEVLENTDMVINRYRQETISLDYYGDSIINSVFDILASVLGFILASRLPARIIVIGIICIEVILIFWIRDSLLLNIIMLIYPVNAIKIWQNGG